MRNDKDSQQAVILAAIGFIPVIWFALLIAPYSSGGLPEILRNMESIMQEPFKITLCDDSLKTVLVMLFAYWLIIGILYSTAGKYRRGIEYGSSVWGNANALNARYAEKHKERNKILTQNVSIGIDGRKHQRNVNVLVCGGSGSGKTRYYAKPNLLSAGEMSYICLDPKGELVRSTGSFLESMGYSIKVLDLISMDKSNYYNPFRYIKDDNDIQRLVTNLFKNTTPKESRSQDPFWDQAAQLLLMALVSYLHYEAPVEDQNFAMVMYMIRCGEVLENDDKYRSALDILFERLEKRNREHIALKYYRSYRAGSAKTLKSIQITLLSHLDKFNLESLATLTQFDEMELETVGEKKTAIFAVIPDNDTSFNFLVGILYTQLFQQLEYRADHIHGGRLPVHVHFIMDEFANCALPEDFDKLLSTMRSREISVSIIVQNLAQIKALFEKQYESILGNCDEFLYLGGNEPSTHKYVSEQLGKETIEKDEYSRARGRNGSFSKNRHITGRDLMMPDEVRLLDNRNAILFIRGERPVMDQKYDILKHPNIKLSEDGGAKSYIHGRADLSIATVKFDTDIISEAEQQEIEKHDFLIFTETELDELINRKLGITE